MKSLTIALTVAAAVFVTGCSKKDGGILSPSEITRTSVNSLASPVIEISRVSGNTMVIRFSGELKVGLNPVPPLLLPDGSQNSIDNVRLYDYSCGPKTYHQGNFGASRENENAASTYFEFPSCGRIDFEWGVLLHDKKFYPNDNHFTYVVPGLLGLRINGRRITSSVTW